jgi:hypothetical protein
MLLHINYFSTESLPEESILWLTVPQVTSVLQSSRTLQGTRCSGLSILINCIDTQSSTVSIHSLIAMCNAFVTAQILGAMASQRRCIAGGLSKVAHRHSCIAHGQPELRPQSTASFPYICSVTKYLRAAYARPARNFLRASPAASSWSCKNSNTSRFAVSLTEGYEFHFVPIVEAKPGWRLLELFSYLVPVTVDGFILARGSHFLTFENSKDCLTGVISFKVSDNSSHSPSTLESDSTQQDVLHRDSGQDCLS